MGIEINRYKYRSRCDVRRCNNTAEYSIGDPDESPSTHFIVCYDHLKQMVHKTIEFCWLKGDQDFIDGITPFVLRKGQVNPKEHRELQYKAKDLEDKLNEKLATIEFLKEENEELKNKLEAVQKPHGKGR